jgi:hypothetical protein
VLLKGVAASGILRRIEPSGSNLTLGALD